MKEYSIVIEETINQEFKVNANSAAEALDIAQQKYKKCEFVLDNASCTFRTMAIASPQDETTDYKPF